MPPLVDLLVVGGGIHGAAVARDAARRGLSVVLAEKDDLAQGTSSRSSKLVHGGIRYLETGQLGLVREALHERAVLLRTAPHLVRPLPFVLPFLRGDRGARPRGLVRLGLLLYDLLSGAGRDEPGVLPRHRLLGPDEARALEPGLPVAGLTGAALFHDARMDDARLVVAHAVDAGQNGAHVLVRTAVTALTKGTGGAWRATLEPGDAIEARLVINAAGPWADRVRGLASRRHGLVPAIRPTRGSHVVVPALTRDHALLLFAADRRVFFVVPWGTRSLVGTTDDDFAGDPGDVAPAAADLRLLRGEIERRWPGHGGPVARAFAGLRPLLARGRPGLSLPWRNTREARLLDEDGILSVVGGKYTTARRLAERAVDHAVARLGAAARVRSCDTATAALPARPWEGAATPLAAEPGIDEATVRHAVEHEFARGAGDVIWRRSPLWLDRAAARAAAPRVAAWMAPLLGWSDATRAAEESAVHEACDEEERWLAAAT
jgi:glycerol-3-phosphate dehydrogenase